jgi:hypothetical protein
MEFLKKTTFLVISFFLFLNSFSQVNLIKNGNFNGLSFWSFYEGSSIATISIVAGEAFLNITSPGTNIWEPQLVQENIDIVNGKEYKLSFKAHSDGVRIINANISTGAPNYQTIFATNVNLSLNSQWFTYTFTAGMSDNTSSLNFDCGGNKLDVYIDSVSLEVNQQAKPPSYMVSGRVADACGLGIFKVLIAVSGDISGGLTTDSTGFFSIVVDSNKSVTLTPEAIGGYSQLLPTQIQINNITAPMPNQNFTALTYGGSMDTFKVSGFIKQCGVALENVKVNVCNKVLVTDQNGYYETYVFGNGKVEFIPFLEGYEFVPKSIEFFNLDQNKTNTNFAANETDSFLISGYVKYKGTGKPIENTGINIFIGEDKDPTSIDVDVFTDSNGYYEYMALDIDDNWYQMTITPSKINFDFSPNVRSLSPHNYCEFDSNDFEGEVDVEIPPTDICIVLVDSNTNKNLIAWERPNTAVIDSYKIYRETTQAGVYELVGAKAQNQLSIVIDQNSNPFQRAYRYYLSIVDTSGKESKVGNIHKTLHLTANKGVGNEINLIWSHYYGFQFSTYKIYRGTKPTNMVLLDSIQSSLSTYTDLSPPSGLLYYQVVVVKNDTCYPDILRAATTSGPFSQSYSNLKDYSADQTDYLEVHPHKMTVSKNSGTYTFKVYTNQNDWTTSCTESWINFNNDFTNKTVTLTFDENTSGSNRSAEITLSKSGLDDYKVIFNQTNDAGGLNDISNNKVKVYPNPFTEKFIIENGLHNGRYLLYNIQGQVIRSGKINGYSEEIDAADIEPGFYALKIYNNQKVITYKLMKQ